MTPVAVEDGLSWCLNRMMVAKNRGSKMRNPSKMDGFLLVSLQEKKPDYHKSFRYAALSAPLGWRRLASRILQRAVGSHRGHHIKGPKCAQNNHQAFDFSEKQPKDDEYGLLS